MGRLLSVDDFVVVEVGERLHYLMQVILHLHLSEALPALYQLVQSLISTDLQQDIHVFMVLKHVLELHYVLIVK